MTKSFRYPIAVIAGLLIAAPAFAQTQTPPDQAAAGAKVAQPSSAPKAGTRSYGAAKKQKTQAGVTDLGPGSRAYYGNTVHAKE